MGFAAHEIEQGSSVGKYEILRKLATGGMAEIYLARVRGIVGFEKLVVLKRILPSVAEDPAFVQMFLDEARLAATLQHPNIADVYDVGTDDGSYFFTMEFIHGEDARTLRITTRKRGERIPLPQALAIVHGTASALHYAHAKKGADGPLELVHRDVSSSNILVSFDGAVKLVDFGIARATSRQSKTQTGTLKGKIPYMSPEQCQNRPLDQRSDLFSLGVVLYELTTGRRPFRGESDFEIFNQIINKGAASPTTVDPTYPDELAHIVMRLLARAPADRYQSADELIVDLEGFMSAHNAWASPRVLGNYMRTVFADKIAIWQAAEDAGALLGDHVASTVTSESMRVERRTPVSAFTAQPAVMDELGAAADEVPTTATPSAVRPAFPASRRRGRWIVAAALAVAAITAIVVVTRSGDHPAATAASEAPAAVDSPPVTREPVEPTTASRAAGTGDEPSGSATGDEPSGSASGAAGSAEAVATPVDEPVVPVATKDVPPPPTVRTTPGRPERPNKKPIRNKPKTKEPSWDRNSLFLPP